MAGHVFGRSSRDSLPTAVQGDGCYIIDADGKRYLDGSGGAAVSCLGHSNEAVRTAIRTQLDSLEFAHTGFFTTDAAEALADRLIARAPEGIDRVYLVSGGSEAMESALKLARQYFVEIGQPQRHRVIARQQSYHGNTLGALAAGGNAWRREKYAPLLVETSHISACFEYRGRAQDESAFDYGQRVANELKDEIERLGPDTVMAFLAEPVVGATIGAVPAVEGYFARIREICDEYGVLLILDEVMCGMGRTGTLYSCEYDAVRPDILAIAKGLGAGYASIGAMLCSTEIYNAIAQGSGSFMHGHTYHGHPLAAAAGLAVLSEIIDRDLLSKVQDTGDALAARLSERFGQHPHVGDTRGRGLFRGIEIVEDRNRKTPFDPARGINGKIKRAAMDEGLICYPAGGTADGQKGDHILLAPPFIIEDHQLDELVDKLDAAINNAIAQ